MENEQELQEVVLEQHAAIMPGIEPEDSLPPPAYKWGGKTINSAIGPWEKAVVVNCGGRTVYDGLKPDEKRTILEIQVKIDDRLIDIKGSWRSMGRLLYEAKKIIPHGQFKRWIQEIWGRELPYSTAACYMGIYAKFKAYPSEAFEQYPLNFLQTIKQKSFPDTVLRIILENKHSLKKAEYEGLIAAHKAFKAGEIDIDEFEELAKKPIEVATYLYRSECCLREQILLNRGNKLGLMRERRALTYAAGYPEEKPKRATEGEVEQKTEPKPYTYQSLSNTPIIPVGNGIFCEKDKKTYGARKFITFFFDRDEDYEIVLAHLQEHGKRFKRHPHMDTNKLVEMVRALQAEELAAKV